MILSWPYLGQISLSNMEMGEILHLKIIPSPKNCPLWEFFTPPPPFFWYSFTKMRITRLILVVQSPSLDQCARSKLCYSTVCLQLLYLCSFHLQLCLNVVNVCLGKPQPSHHIARPDRGLNPRLFTQNSTEADALTIRPQKQKNGGQIPGSIVRDSQRVFLSWPRFDQSKIDHNDISIYRMWVFLIQVKNGLCGLGSNPAGASAKLVFTWSCNSGQSL